MGVGVSGVVSRGWSAHGDASTGGKIPFNITGLQKQMHRIMKHITTTRHTTLHHAVGRGGVTAALRIGKPEWFGL